MLYDAVSNFVLNEFTPCEGDLLIDILCSKSLSKFGVGQAVAPSNSSESDKYEELDDCRRRDGLGYSGRVMLDSRLSLRKNVEEVADRRGSKDDDIDGDGVCEGDCGRLDNCDASGRPCFALAGNEIIIRN
jgi:hypothetical protein